MHVHYSNTLINILRITETHIIICYQPTMEQSGRAGFRSPRIARACRGPSHVRSMFAAPMYGAENIDRAGPLAHDLVQPYTFADTVRVSIVRL